MPNPIGRVKACTECRQQKVRCDAYEDYSRPCSRCRASNLPCIITKKFERRERHTKAQLQYELEKLRQAKGDHENVSGTEASISSPSTSHHHARRSSRSPSREPPHKRQRLSLDDSAAEVFQPQTGLLQRLLDRFLKPVTDSVGKETSHIGSFKPTIPAKVANKSSSAVVSRTIENVEVDGEVIEDCYQSFFANYAPHLEGLFDEKVGASQRFEQCPALFWTMISIGSRGHRDHPKLYSKLAQPVLRLITESLLNAAQALHVIAAIIVICAWPMPFDLIHKDPSQALAGAATGLAIQHGLHMYCFEQDFVVKNFEATPNPSYTTTEIPARVRDKASIFRTRLWTYCIIIFQSSNVCDGLPPAAMSNAFRRSDLYGDSGAFLPELTAYRLTLHKIVIEIVNIVGSGAVMEGTASHPILATMIASFDDRLRDIAKPQDNAFCQFMLSCGRLIVLGLFFLSTVELDDVRAARLFHVSLEVLSCAVILENQIPNFTFYMPDHYLRMCLYAGHIVLRVTKSPLGGKMAIEEASTALFACVDILRRRGLVRHDHNTVAAIMLEQMWKSSKCFAWDNKIQNGLRVHIRHRMAFNPIFDTYWWWRREFGHAYETSMKKSLTGNRTEEHMDSQLQHSSSQSLPKRTDPPSAHHISQDEAAADCSLGQTLSNDQCRSPGGRSIFPLMKSSDTSNAAAVAFTQSSQLNPDTYDYPSASSNDLQQSSASSQHDLPQYTDNGQLDDVFREFMEWWDLSAVNDMAPLEDWVTADVTGDFDGALAT